MAFDARYKGVAFYPKGTNVNVRESPSTTAKVLYNSKSPSMAGYGTGTFWRMTDDQMIWFEIQSGSYKGFVREDVVSATPAKVETAKPTTTDAMALINNLIESDKRIYEILLRTAPLIKAAKDKGRKIATQENSYRALANRLSKRQESLKDSRILKWKTGLKEGYDKLVSTFKNLFGISGVGEITTLSAIVISAVAGAGLTAAAYFTFKPKYSESTTDLKVSADLEKALSSLEPEVAQQVKDDLEKQVDKAYSQGKTDGTMTGVFKLLKPLALMAGGYFLVTKFMNNENKRSKK